LISVVAQFHDAYSVSTFSSPRPMPEPKRPAMNRGRESSSELAFSFARSIRNEREFGRVSGLRIENWRKT
jgi:hypothetical protein